VRRALLLVVALAACGGDDGASTMIDAAVQMPDAQNPATCLIPGDYGDVGSKTGAQTNMGGISGSFTLDAGPPRDTFFLKMVANKGVFSGGINPGTYTISGVDAQYNNCGLCVHIIADIGMTGPSKFYFAESGMVTLTSVNMPITGSATNVMLREVDIGSGDFVPFGCRASISSIMFTTM
jgi:hypothetical protein